MELWDKGLEDRLGKKRILECFGCYELDNVEKLDESRHIRTYRDTFSGGEISILVTEEDGEKPTYTFRSYNGDREVNKNE